MKILISSYTLEYTGVPTYTYTLYKELKNREHDVVIYSPKSGAMRGLMPVVSEPVAADVVLAQHNKCANKVRSAFPRVPMIFICHGVLPELEQPPRISIQWYVAVNEQCFRLLVNQHVDAHRISIIRDFVDIEEFKPTQLLKKKPRVLFVSNYKKWRAHRNIEVACKELGLEFKAVGSPYGKSGEMAKEINKYDLVIGWGRSVLEGMACGRPVISYNKLYGDGYLTPDVYIESRQRNFGGYECLHHFGKEGVVKEISKYKPEDGVASRKLIERHHNSKIEVDKIMEIINERL